ncbi:uncharacterized protein C8A04DRAFT_8974 [Dichotomopilus funicola]|uniref:Glucose-methanol-choline oxidoreductase N-terminal domain-containing protein n=1 Tax=Dichotomopilus funicola TaxID=1934379 RepID=A0AAN6V9I1_9PEZI|nr:hypothetical protein C8A04DRAFT_8974 [Dichotomopilus funicola]
MRLCGVVFISLVAATSATSNSHAKRQVSQLRDRYDFLVVGGGTSGLTVADRLSEAFPSKTVLVIEYGDVHYAPGTFDPPTNWITANPDAAPAWSFNSVPNLEFGNKTAFVQAGQVVGGSSAVNGMFFDRGSQYDYDAWTEAGGPEFAQSSIKWDWEGIFPYFKKSVTFTEPPAEIAEKYNYTWDLSAFGGSTPIHSSFPAYQWVDLSVRTDAFRDMGLASPKECASGDKDGICWAPVSQHPVTARRSHSGLGHYADVQPRSNYDLLVKHQVVRVVYPDGPNSGPPLVEAKSLDDGHLFNVTVDGEVIVSAGALHTPTVLLRSGIGPAAVLSDAGIPLTLDLPGVGSNFQDHSGPMVTWSYTKSYDFWPLPNDFVNNATLKADATAGFDETPARGPYTMAGGNSAIFVSLPHLADNHANITKKILAMIADGSATSYLPADLRSIPEIAAGYSAQLAALAKLLSNPEAPSIESPWATSQATVSAPSFLLHPLSRGTVRLDKNNHLAQPVLDYRAGSNPVDFDLHRAHVRFLRKLVETPTLTALGVQEIGPGKDVAADDETLDEYVRSSAVLSFMHPCCTAAMLPENLGGVVGTDLKVHGAKGLRVVDMSVMPFLIGSHLSATAYAVGEKAADIIINEWKSR